MSSEKPLISIIVPVFNVKSYIEDCVKSIIAQTYSNIECIIVDDCGTDESMEIVRKVLSNYMGPIAFQIVAHTENRGLSIARNTGTDIAHGEYIYYLDSDDLIHPRTIEILVSEIIRNNVDVVCAEFQCFYNKIPSFIPDVQYESHVINNKRQIIGAFCNKTLRECAWNKLIRKSFIEDKKLSFFRGILHEDYRWAFDLMIVLESVCVVPVKTYFYRRHENSITTSRSKKLREDLVGIVCYENQILEKMEDVSFYPELKKYVDIFTVQSVFNVLTLRNSIIYNYNFYKKLYHKRKYNLKAGNRVSGISLKALESGGMVSFLFLVCIATLYKMGVCRLKVS